jgi:hypothetical protein
MLTRKNYCKPGVNWMVMLSSLAMDYSLQSATFQVLRFGVMLVFSSQRETFDGGEGLNSSHGCCTRNSFQFFIFPLKYMN